jgi:hypothetical protein
MRKSDIVLLLVILSAVAMFRWWLKKERCKNSHKKSL